MTDIVPEQLGTGEAEPAPTPAVGESPKEELDQPGGIAKADEEIAEAKQEDEGGVKQEEAGKTPAASDNLTAENAEATPEPVASSVEEPTVEEVVPETSSKTKPAAEAEQPAAENKREQQRLDNPVYTLEVVGNRYNPSNFW